MVTSPSSPSTASATMVESFKGFVGSLTEKEIHVLCDKEATTRPTASHWSVSNSDPTDGITELSFMRPTHSWLGRLISQTHKKDQKGHSFKLRHVMVKSISMQIALLKSLHELHRWDPCFCGDCQVSSLEVVGRR